MPQLIILMGVLSVANFAFFNYGVDIYEETQMDDEGGVVEVYEVSENTEAAQEPAAEEATEE